MDILVSWGNIITASFGNLLAGVLAILPEILGAIIVFIIGLFVAEGVGRLVARILAGLKVDMAIDRTGAKAALAKVGFKNDVSHSLGVLVTWFLYVVFLIAAAEILRLYQISDFLTTVVFYIPNVIIDVAILIIGAISGNFVGHLISGAAEKLGSAKFMSAVGRWSVYVFTAMAALVQLKVATELIQILFTGLVFMFALAGGLAFGIGGKDKAKDLLGKVGK